MAPRKERKPTKTNMRRKIANLNAKRLRACMFAKEEESTPINLTTSTSADPVVPSSECDVAPVELATPVRLVTSSQASESASKRKISLFESEPAPSADLPTTIIDLSTIAALYCGVLCPYCKCPGLQLCHNKRRDKSLAVYLELWCSICQININAAYTSKKILTGQSFEVNRKAVITGLTAGLGHAGLMKLCEGLGMPSMHKKTYADHFDNISKTTDGVKDNILNQSRQKVVDYYRREEPGAFDEDGVLNIGVSYDGTWAKRGHTSKIGAGAVIEIMTGLVIDFHVMSLYCQLCASVGERLRQQNPAAYAEWLQVHKTTGKCTKNYEGSSGGMEVAGALKMWGRSLDYGVRYTTFVGDGDTKTFSALVEKSPYGTDHTISKEECVNHVSKRLNTALRNLVSSMSKQNVRLGGNKKGSLSAPKIGLLQSYYTKAVRSFNSSTEEMAKAIWASFFHSISTKELPQHQYCPAGEESWCWYQRALMTGPVDPTLHDRQHSTFLNSDVAPYVRKVYERLTDSSLLSRCLLGKTQNCNESLHSVIWDKCPKHTFSGLKRVSFGVTLAVGEYNMGSSASHLFFPAVGCIVTSATTSLGHKRDTERIKRAEKAHSVPEKKRREARKLAQQRAQQAATTAEGGPSYVAGGF
ncbi:hypothetical protein PoB_007069800 [Plakobranchus ocellatus]|uniref:Mutator-like transposase domain-containing protein n=1 Tax=Plakobranchus ocellatus TaxID=259542 RepID=A0AAV4DIU4_9GAST|nr:hypothetical protein PoB_007069800 [Plakobranchus ocellatus]